MSEAENEKINLVKELLKERFLIEDKLRKMHESILNLDKQLFMIENRTLQQKFIGMFNNDNKMAKKIRKNIFEYLNGARASLIEMTNQHQKIMMELCKVNL